MGVGWPGAGGDPATVAWFINPESSRNLSPILLSKLRCKTMVLCGPRHCLISALNSA